MLDAVWNTIYTIWNAAFAVPPIDIFAPLLAFLALCAIHRVASAKFRVVAILILSVFLFLSGVWTHTDYVRIQSTQTTQAPSLLPLTPTPNTK